MTRTFDLIWSLCLSAAIALAMVGLLFASVLAGRVYRESARADAAIHEHVLADNACVPTDWRERAKCAGVI